VKRIQGELSKTREGALGYLEFHKTLSSLCEKCTASVRCGIWCPNLSHFIPKIYLPENLYFFIMYRKNIQILFKSHTYDAYASYYSPLKKKTAQGGIFYERRVWDLNITCSVPVQDIFVAPEGFKNISEQLQIPEQSPRLFALLHSLRSLRRVWDLNPRGLLDPASLAVRCFRPLSQLSVTAYCRVGFPWSTSRPPPFSQTKLCPTQFCPLSQLSIYSLRSNGDR